MASKRVLQVAERIREHIAMMIVRGEVSDPRIRNVTINSVKVTPDLHTAKIYFSVYGDDVDKGGVEAGLRKASGFMRNSIGKNLGFRFTPELHFYYDDSVEKAIHMSTVLEKVKRERESQNETTSEAVPAKHTSSASVDNDVTLEDEENPATND